MNQINDVLDVVDKEIQASIDRLGEIIRIPSISTDPAHAADCRKAGQWTADELSKLGFDAMLRETAGLPMVVAHSPAENLPSTAPHALFYGHYDVQPADPLEKWVTPPFDLVRKTDNDGVERLYGRGTADDKGQFMTFVEAARAWIKVTGSLPIKATFLIEGEEESGSPSLIPFLKENEAELSHDVALVCDTNMWDAKTPAITTRLRGMAREEVTITGPRIDLHSGAYGGPAQNPIRVLSKILAAIHDKNGKVTIPGFYDGVEELPLTVKKQWKSLKFSEKQFLGEVGLSIPAGEKGRSVLEQIWARPTAEVNGIYGGYTGAGTKTVLPSTATAKITFRLVGKQNPKKIIAAFRKFVKERLPKDCKATFSPQAGGSPAFVVEEDNPLIRKVASALKAEFGRDAILMGSGGSIPICRSFKDILGMESVLVGFGLDDDAIHSPNEKYNLSSFHHGIRSWVRIFAALAG
jgi:acetylornithine deacetylase/succinyl-diaminopimelate desuccinylase-like protein